MAFVYQSAVEKVKTSATSYMMKYFGSNPETSRIVSSLSSHSMRLIVKEFVSEKSPASDE